MHLRISPKVPMTIENIPVYTPSPLEKSLVSL